MEMTGKATPQFVKRAWSVSVTALYTIVQNHHCQDLQRFFEMEMTGKATPQFVKRAWSVLVTAFYTIVQIDHCQDLQRLFEMEITGKVTPQFVKMAWSVSVTALYTIVEYHHFSGSSPNIWNGDDRKSDTLMCQEGMKCFSNSFIYDCCISSVVKIFVDYLKWRWQENRHLILSRGNELFQWQLHIRLLNLILCHDLHRIFEMEMTGKATPQFFKRTWIVSVTALYTIVV